MTAIRHIVFDIGKVLLHYDPDLPYRRLIPDETERRWFLENVCTADWNLEQDRGRKWSDAEELLIVDFPEHEAMIRAFRANWHEMVPHAHEDSVSIMLGLIEAGHDVTMLTNFAADTFAAARQRYHFLDRPRGTTVSGEVGLIKPDLAIFRHHEASFGIDPAAAIFIDDTPRNVEGAKKAGWRAVLFEGAGRLAEDLRASGIDA